MLTDPNDLAQIVREFVAAVGIELPAGSVERLSRQVINIEEECRRQKYEIAQYRDRSNAIYAYEHGEHWAWIPNDETGQENHLETLTCPVLIPAEWLRNLLEEAKETGRDVALAQAARFYKVIKGLEWFKYFDTKKERFVVICPWCRQTSEQGHSADCIIGQALADGADGVSAKAVFELVGALRGLVGDTGLHYDDCECDNTHEQNGTVCLYCYARDMLAKYDLHA